MFHAKCIGHISRISRSMTSHQCRNACSIASAVGLRGNAHGKGTGDRDAQDPPGTQTRPLESLWTIPANEQCAYTGSPSAIDFNCCGRGSVEYRDTTGGLECGWVGGCWWLWERWPARCGIVDVDGRYGMHGGMEEGSGLMTDCCKGCYPTGFFATAGHN